jgi:hypothetical protein
MLTQPTTTASITPLFLTVTGITASNKVYDGTTAATIDVSAALLNGVIPTDVVTLDTSLATGAFQNKTAANGKTVQISGLTIGGADVANYALTQPTATADITRRSLTVTGVTANSKVYDGTATATLNTGGAALVGIQMTDSVTLTTGGATGMFSDRNVGTGKSVTIAGLVIGGGDAGDYTLSQPPATADITAKPVTASITAASKSYDGTNSATILSCTPSGVVGGDPVTCVASGGAFADPNSGLGKTVTATVSLAGAGAGNYALTASTATTTASIVPAATTSALASSVNPSNYGQATTFTATVTAPFSLVPTGSVAFYNAAAGATCAALGTSALIDTQPLALGSAGTSTSALPTGSNTILACYGGDVNFAPSSSTLTQTVIPAPIASLNPTSVSFGNQLAGTSSTPVPVTLTNTGTAALTPITLAITGPNAGFFTQTNTCGSSLAAGANCKIYVTFSPTASGVATAVLTLTDNDRNVGGSQQLIGLTGAGTSSITGSSLFSYAIFATSNGCGAITTSGGGFVDSFDSSQGYAASHQNAGAVVGTNGNLTMSGKTIIYGTASSPLTGSGACKSGIVTAYNTSGQGQVTGGFLQLAGPVTYAAPAAPNPAPPTSGQSISGSCGTVSGCTAAGSKAVNLAPGAYGNLSLNGGTTAHVSRGSYNVNSLTLTGNSILVVDSGPVVVNIVGSTLGGGNTALDLSGGSIVNPSGIPINLQFYYGGTKSTKLSGGTSTYAIVYAPNSAVNLSGGTDFFGAIVGSTVNLSGSTAVHYDRHLPGIAGGDYLWFNSATMNVTNVPSGGAKLYVTNATVTINGGAPISVPNAVVIFSSSATTAKTSWDATNNRWSTIVPRATVNGNSTIRTFLDGLAYLVPAGGYPNGIQSMTWSAAFSTDSPGITFQWQWAAAEYTTFSAVYGNGTNTNILGVVPVDGTDPAGTPASFKAFLTDGGSGGGGTNWTGFYVGSAGVAPTTAPASVAPSSLAFGSLTVGTTSASMPVVLTNNQATSLTIGSISASGDFAQSNTCPAVLAGGTSCTINVTFTPTATGARTGKITVNDDANNSPQTAYLTGTGQ